MEMRVLHHTWNPGDINLPSTEPGTLTATIGDVNLMTFEMAARSQSKSGVWLRCRREK